MFKCGDANPNGNVALTYKGGCMGKLDLKDAYRCTGCGGWFHKDCIFKHFELEKEHDFGRQQEREEIIKFLIDMYGEWGDPIIHDLLENTKNLTNLSTEGGD